MANEVYQLVVRKGPRPGQVFLLELDVLTIGRDPISDIVIEDPEISRHHAKLTQTPDGFELQDMGSTNGTFVDGQRLSGPPVSLNPGQVIMLGSNVTLVFNAAPASDPLATVVAPAAVPAPSRLMPEEEDEEPAEEPVEAPVDESEVEVSGREPAEEPVVVEPIATAPLEPSEEPQPVEDEDDAIKTMMEERPVVLEQPEPELEPLPTFDEPEPLPTFDEPEPEPEPLPAFDEPVPEPEPGQLPDYDAPTPLPSFEEPEPEPPPAKAEEPPLEKEPFDQTIIDSGEPLPDFDAQIGGEPPPIEPVGVTEGKKGDDRNRNIIIAVVVVLLLCCCCLIILAVLFSTTDGFQNLSVFNSSNRLLDSALVLVSV